MLDLNYSNFINFTSFYPYYFYTILSITTVLFALEQFVIFTQTPKQMKSTKWFILNVSLANFLLVLFQCLYQDMPIFYPLSESMSKGFFGLFGTFGTFLAFWIISILTLNLIQSYTSVMWYQFGIFKGKGRLAEFVLNLKTFAMFYGACMGLKSLTMFLMLLFVFKINRNDVYQHISRNNTKLFNFVNGVLENQPSAVVYASNSNIWLSLFTIFFSIQVLFELFMVIFFNINLLKTIRATSKIVTKKTLSLQKSFYRSALIESIFVLTFVLIPSFIAPSLALFQIVDLRVGIIGFNLAIISAPISYVMNMILIRPYRRFFVKVIKRKFESSTVGVINVKPNNVVNT